MSINIGDTDAGEHISIPIHHTAIFGMTGVGKTKLLKHMLAQAVEQGFRVIIFDSKITGPEFAGIGEDLPFYMESPIDESLGQIDPDAIQALCEGMRTRKKANMDRYRGGFIEICKDAKDFAEVNKNLQSKLADNHVRGNTRLMYQEIAYDFVRLLKMLKTQHFSNTMVLPTSIGRVPTCDLPNIAIQGLVVRSMVESLLRWPQWRKVVIIVDEAPNFIHQKKYNPAKDALQQLDAQGRSTEKFGWYSGQTITGIDKASLKNTWYWIMGREQEQNEAKDVYDTQTYKVRSADEVKQLKVRQFIVSTPDWAKLVMVPKIDTTEAGEGARNVSTKNSNDGGGRAQVAEFRSDRRLQGTQLRKTTSANVATTTSGLSTAPRASIDNEAHEPAPTPRADPSGTGKNFFREWNKVIREMPEPDQTFSASVKPAELTPNPRTDEPPKTETKPIGSFTLEVTRLQSDSLEAKLVYIIKNKGAGRQSEILAKGLEFGWHIDSGNASKAFRRMVADGTLVYTGHQDYRLPTDESFKVIEVPAQ